MALTLGVLMAALIIRRSTEGDNMRSPYVQRSTRHRHAAEISMKLTMPKHDMDSEHPSSCFEGPWRSCCVWSVGYTIPDERLGDHTGDVLAERLWQLQRPFV
jgi:hypothetical protein